MKNLFIADTKIQISNLSGGSYWIVDIGLNSYRLYPLKDGKWVVVNTNNICDGEFDNIATFRCANKNKALHKGLDLIFEHAGILK